MKKLLLVILMISLGGCATVPTVEPAVLIKNVYLIPSLSADVTDLPKDESLIDLMTASQLDVARWLNNEKRIVELEGKLLATKNIAGILVQKNALKPGDYKIIELTKKDLIEAK